MDCRDTKRLLHEAIWFIPIPIRTFMVIVAFTHTSRRLSPRGRRSGGGVSSLLSLHLSIGEEAAGNSACRPRLSIRPSSHSSFPFIPHKHASRSDAGPFLFRQTSLYSWEQTGATSLKQYYCILRRLDVSVVSFHPSIVVFGPQWSYLSLLFPSLLLLLLLLLGYWDWCMGC